MDEDLLLVIKQNGEKLQGNCSHSALLQLQGNFNLKKFQPAEDSFFMVSCIEACSKSGNGFGKSVRRILGSISG